MYFIENVVTRHTDLFWNVNFDKQNISGEAILHFDIVAKEIERIVSSCWYSLSLCGLKWSIWANSIKIVFQHIFYWNHVSTFITHFVLFCFVIFLFAKLVARRKRFNNYRSQHCNGGRKNSSQLLCVGFGKGYWLEVNHWSSNQNERTIKSLDCIWNITQSEWLAMANPRKYNGQKTSVYVQPVPGKLNS